MKLYYAPGACSLASHIALREAEAGFSLEKVDTSAGLTETKADYAAINPNGYVPALRLDDGNILTEGAAVLQYIADRSPDASLAPEAGTFERSRLHQHLNYIASEFHKAFRPLFSDGATEADKKMARENVAQKLDYLESLFADGRPYLLGDTFSVADAYLFVVANWTGPTRIGLDEWPSIKAFTARVSGREKVREAMQAEGLLN